MNKYYGDWLKVDDLDRHVRQCLAYSYNHVVDHVYLFKTRLDVLHHIFIVGGSGYEWGDDGELYYLDPNHEFEHLVPIAELPEMDYLNEYPYPSLGIAKHIPDNARPEIKAAVLEVIAAWKRELSLVKEEQTS